MESMIQIVLSSYQNHTSAENKQTKISYHNNGSKLDGARIMKIGKINIIISQWTNIWYGHGKQNIEYLICKMMVYNDLMINHL